MSGSCYKRGATFCPVLANGQTKNLCYHTYYSWFGLKVMRVTSAAFESSILASSASAEAALMSLREDQADFCPHCRSPFEIVIVKFRLNGTAMVATCPNCAIASVHERRADNVKKLAITTRGFWHGVARMDPLDRRFKYVVAFLIGALITAAALRHVLHVYGGITREEIRWDALMAIPAVALGIIFFRRKRRR
jgi:hypothetical protein